MSEDKRTRLKRWLESGEITLQPLTFPQRELWEASAVPVTDVSNHICSFIEVRGALSTKDCEAAIQRVVDRQDVLRLSILPGREQPLQMIRAKSAPAMRFYEFSSSANRAEALEELMHAVFDEPFDFVQGPLYRVDMVRRGTDDYLLIFTIHHAIADGWSLGAFVKDLCSAYVLGRTGGAGGLSPLQLSYSAWGAAERAFWQPEKIDQHMPFWRSHLDGASKLCDGDLHIAPGPLRRLVSAITPAVSQRARELTRQTGVTLFSTLLTAFQIALSRWTGATDIVVGTPVAHRNKRALHETMGYCSGVVPIRSRVEPERPFSNAVRLVHQDSLDCFANAIPFAELVPRLGDSARTGENPVFDLRFALQNHPIPYAEVPGFSVRLTMCSTGTARFHLGCEVTEDDQSFEVVWLYRPELFSEEEVRKLGCLFEAVLEGVFRSPERRVAALSV